MIFIFPGQGSQYVGMGKNLYNQFPVAKEVFDEVDSILNRNLSDIIFDGSIEELTVTENAQPAIMAVSIATLRVIENIFGKSLFSDYKVQYVCGHSVGEYTALCFAGALTLDATVKLLQVRSKAMHEASMKCAGGMIALLGAELSEIENILESAQFCEICEIANDNGGRQVIVSGTIKGLEILTDLLKNSNVKRIIKLQVSGPFHSSLMKSAEEKVLEFLNTVKITNPKVPLISNVTAKEESNPETIRGLLAKQIISRVRWREMVLYMQNCGISNCIEIGPNKILSNLVKRINPFFNVKNIDTIDDLNNFCNESLFLTKKDSPFPLNQSV